MLPKDKSNSMSYIKIARGVYKDEQIPNLSLKFMNLE